MKRKILISESKLKKLISKVLSEQYDTESPSIDIMHKLIKIGIPDRVIDQAMEDIEKIEMVKDFNRKRDLVIQFKMNVNNFLDKHDINLDSPKYANTIKLLDIALDRLYKKIDFSDISLN